MKELVPKENITNPLVEASSNLENSLKILEEINQKSTFIGLCASIEGAKMRSRTTTFSMVAQQITSQAEKNSKLSATLRGLISQIQRQALNAVAIRNLELAQDLIDKLDRNLFERNCDVQAWATFDIIKNAIIFESNDAVEQACEQLQKLVDIYVVYSESVLLDRDGKVIACAKDRSLIGKNFSNEEWFRPTVQGQVFVTDAHESKVIDRNSVNYCAPVMSDENEVIGVLANFFNWDFALEMISSAGYQSSTSAVIVNAKTKVIASKLDSQIMRDHYDWLIAGTLASEKYLGYSLENLRNGEAAAIGFCHTKGYNAYRGKGWSAVIAERIKPTYLPIEHKVINQRDPEGNLVIQDQTEIPSEISGKELLKTMKDIDSLVYEINANNKEVKLLAVNASIQAGLAGEDGEGFSVIAKEVADLAKKSLEFVEVINGATDTLRRVVDESISIRLQDAAKDTASKIDRNLFERYCDIQAWSTFDKFKEVLSEGKVADTEAIALLQKIHKIYEVYHDLYILDVDGKVSAPAIESSMTGKVFADEEWFQKALSGKIYYSDIEYSDVYKGPVIKFSAPILDVGKKVVGVIVSWFNCNFLNDIIKAAIVDSHTESFLLNSQHQVIAAKDTSAIFEKSFTSQLQENEFSKSNGSGITKTSGHNESESFVVGYSSSKGYNTYQGQSWVVITSRPSSVKSDSRVLDPVQLFRQKMRWCS